MKAIILGTLLAVCASTAADAQSCNASTRIDTFTTSALRATLAELGATTEDRDGVQNMTVRFSNGLVADALLMACEDQATSTNCLGTSILASFATPKDATPEQVREGINEYNYRQNFGRAYVSPNGTIQVRLYVIADGGITMENYRQMIGLFARSAAKLPGYIAG